MLKENASPGARLRAWNWEHIVTSIFHTRWKQTNYFGFVLPTQPLSPSYKQAHQQGQRKRSLYLEQAGGKPCLLLIRPVSNLLHPTQSVAELLQSRTPPEGQRQLLLSTAKVLLSDHFPRSKCKPDTRHAHHDSPSPIKVTPTDPSNSAPSQLHRSSDMHQRIRVCVAKTLHAGISVHCRATLRNSSKVWYFASTVLHVAWEKTLTRDYLLSACLLLVKIFR